MLYRNNERNWKYYTDSMGASRGGTYTYPREHHNHNFKRRHLHAPIDKKSHYSKSVQAHNEALLIQHLSWGLSLNQFSVEYTVLRKAGVHADDAYWRQWAHTHTESMET